MEHLVNRLKAKDQTAFKVLYDQYSKPMYNVCYRIANNSEDANDILQESFIKIFENIGQLKNNDLLSAWIKRICINTAIQAIKTKKKIKFEEFDEKPGLINLLDEKDIINESDFENNILAIREAITSLPERYRIVFTLHVIEDYNHEEISKILGIVSGTSRSQYLRAKQRLIEILKKNNNVRPIEKIYSAV